MAIVFCILRCIVLHWFLNVNVKLLFGAYLWLNADNGISKWTHKFCQSAHKAHYRSVRRPAPFSSFCQTSSYIVQSTICTIIPRLLSSCVRTTMMSSSSSNIIVVMEFIASLAPFSTTFQASFNFTWLRFKWKLHETQDFNLNLNVSNENSNNNKKRHSAGERGNYKINRFAKRSKMK